ncbi:MAG: glycoside hydrolase family 127 protein [Acidobacteria bacterium]|nr:glycoside hydrolase family 127 protein [Acidobacteriota bacterium]
MRRRFVLPFLIAAAPLLGAAGDPDFSASPYARLKSVGMEDVQWTRGFWADRVRVSRDVTLPEIWKTMQLRGNGAFYGNLRIAAGLEKGAFQGNNWSDGDICKWLEAGSLLYGMTHDQDLDRRMDEVIGVIAKAQAPDGYLSTDIQLTQKQRWVEPRNHEVYNMTHLMDAAAAHYRATGKTNLLDVAKRSADYLYKLFSPRPVKLAHFGAPSDIMGIVELYRTTRDPRYLELAKIFVDIRGSAPGGSDNFQDRIPLRKEVQATGHAMHATYLFATATDVYTETGDESLLEASKRLWQNVALHKMYVTGAVGPLDPGISPRRDIIGEAFGKNFELPNREGYNETCANIGNALWNRRMLAATGEAKYADVMELVLYNSMLSGIGVDGNSFFYTNVHRRFGDELPLLRNESPLRWKNTTEAGAAKSYCCPPNVLRTILKTGNWAYSVSKGDIWVNLYGSNTLKAPVALKQETGYPWDGKIRITFEQASKGEMALMLRIPGWAESAAIQVNGKPVSTPARPSSYAEVRRQWAKGDVVELNLPMPARLVEANPYMEVTGNQVAVMRGPLVYCLESPDLPAGVRVNEVSLPADIQLKPRWDANLLAGLTVLEGEARWNRAGDWSNLLYRTFRSGPGENVSLRLIPYYAWANRGLSHMTVWLPLAH